MPTSRFSACCVSWGTVLASVVLCLVPLAVAARAPHVPVSLSSAQPQVQAATRAHQSWRTRTAPRPGRPCKKKVPLGPQTDDYDDSDNDDNDNNDELSRSRAGAPLQAVLPIGAATAVGKSAPLERLPIAATPRQPLYLTQLCLLI